MNTNSKPCPDCGGVTLYQTSIKSAGPYGPMLLPGLGSLFRFARFEIVVCADCGLTRLYAEPDARAKLSKVRAWKRM